MTTAHELLTQARGLLLDFGGPLAALMPPPANAQAADKPGQRSTGSTSRTPSSAPPTTSKCSATRSPNTQSA